MNDAQLIDGIDPFYGDAERPDANGWLSIASAPRDGTPVLVCAMDDEVRVVGEAYHREREPGPGWWWAGMDWGDNHAETLEASGFIVTHWQPLPPPPVGEAGEGR